MFEQLYCHQRLVHCQPLDALCWLALGCDVMVTGNRGVAKASHREKSLLLFPPPSTPQTSVSLPGRLQGLMEATIVSRLNCGGLWGTRKLASNSQLKRD